MYIVKLSLSVNGLPSAATRGYTRFVSRVFDCETPFDALDKAQHFSTAPVMETAVTRLYHAVARYCHEHGTNAILNARYNVYYVYDSRYDFVEQRVCAASYTRHYYFDYDNN